MKKIFFFTFLISASFFAFHFNLYSEYDESTGLYKIDKIFAGEQMGDNNVWRFIGNGCRYCETSKCAKENKIPCVVFYARSSKEREKYSVLINNGLLYIPERDIQECPARGRKKEEKKISAVPGYELLNTIDKRGIKKNKERKDCYTSVGANIFVMDERGNIYTHPFNEVGKFHHSSFLAGDPVLFAGNIIVLDGEIKYIDNLSGHYKPRAEAIQIALNKLTVLRVDVSNVEIARVAESEESKKLGAGARKKSDPDNKAKKKEVPKAEEPYGVYFMPVDYLSDPDKNDPDNPLLYLNQINAPRFDVD